MFRHRLYVAFAVLAFLTVVQATAALWAGHVASQQAEHSRIANQMLVEFIKLGADKQRLKVWLAQALLTQENNTDARERYLQKMQNNLREINQLLVQDQQLAQTPDDFAAIHAQLKTLSILETNVTALERSLQKKAAVLNGPLSAAQTWTLLIQIFDNLEGLDLKTLIADAIALQEQRASSAEAKAAEALQHAKQLVILTCLLTVVLAMLAAFLLSRTMYQPMQRLLQATNDLAHGMFERRLPEVGPYEFQQLASRLNQLASHLQQAKHNEAAHTKHIEQVVTERTAQLQEAVGRLQQADQIQQRFFADVSHELRTPATTIRGEAEVALRGQDKTAADYKDSLLRIVDTSQQLSRRIDDLLLLIRSEQPLQMRFHQHPLHQLWPRWCALATRVAAANHLPFTAVEHVSPSTQHLFLDTDKADQALQILLDNAVRYGGGKPIELWLDVVDDQLQLGVRDYGIGVAPDEQADIFQRYYRADNARTLRPDGMGIGLALCRSLMQAQHGDVALRTPAPNAVGSLFILRFPFVDDEPDTDASIDY